jgi:hypothetical protein
VGGALHPGRGKYLIKSGERIGLPVSLRLTPGELALYDTDGVFGDAEGSRKRAAGAARAEPLAVVG